MKTKKKAPVGHLSINGTWKYFPLGIYSQVTSFEEVMQTRVGSNSRSIHLIYSCSLPFLLGVSAFWEEET